jgi:hypothetical protein
MKRLLVIALMIFMLGCTGGPLAYQKPLTTAPPETSVSLAKNSKAAVFKAAQQVLVSEGYQITNANEASGVISTAYRNLKVTPEQADCGSLWGHHYLDDTRTTTRVAFGVVVTEDKLTVRADIQGEFPGKGIGYVVFTCVSRGPLENSLLNKIMAAAILK